MQPTDAGMFAKAMDRLFSIYGTQITTAMREAWWGTMQDFELRHVMEAMNMHAQDPDGGRFVPTPAHIVRMIEEAKARQRRRMAEIQAQYAPEIRAIEDRLYRAEHDKQLERIDSSAAQVIITDCHQKLRAVKRTMAAQLRQEGHYVEKGANNAQRVIGA